MSIYICFHYNCALCNGGKGQGREGWGVCDVYFYFYSIVDEGDGGGRAKKNTNTHQP